MRRQMTIRVYKKPKKKVARTTFNGPKEKWCRPKLIYSIDGKSILTSSKWYKNAYTCIYDWLQRGFLVIEDRSIGGGFEYRDFPIVDIKTEVEKWEEKFKNGVKNVE